MNRIPTKGELGLLHASAERDYKHELDAFFAQTRDEQRATLLSILQHRDAMQSWLSMAPTPPAKTEREQKMVGLLYVHGKRYKTTAVIKGEASTLMFNEAVLFKKAKRHHELIVEVRDTSGLGRDHGVGCCHIPLNDLPLDQTEERVCSLHLKSSKATYCGELRILVQFRTDPLNMDPDMIKLQNPNRTFGISLEDLSERENRRVPRLAHACFAYIKENGISTVGIFRLCGSQEAIISMRDQYDTALEHDFEIETDDVHAVAGLMKAFFDALPIPLLTFELYSSFIAVPGLANNRDRIARVKELLAKLPDTHVAVLEELLHLCADIHDNSELNKMNASNLGIVFGSLLLRSERELPLFDALKYANDAAALIEFLIVHVPVLFPRPGRDRGTPLDFHIKKRRNKAKHERAQTASSGSGPTFRRTPSDERVVVETKKAHDDGSSSMPLMVRKIRPRSQSNPEFDPLLLQEVRRSAAAQEDTFSTRKKYRRTAKPQKTSTLFAPGEKDGVHKPKIGGMRTPGVTDRRRVVKKVVSDTTVDVSMTGRHPPPQTTAPAPPTGEPSSPAPAPPK